MTRTRTLLCWAYGLIAVAALALTWSQFVLDGPTSLAGFWMRMTANHTTRGITVDLAFFLLAAALFMVGEARRLNIRFVWLYLVLGYLIDISVAFPIFLIVRERAMARTGETDAGFTASDLVAVAAVTAVVAWESWLVLR